MYLICWDISEQLFYLSAMSYCFLLLGFVQKAKDAKDLIL